ncbi:hypothetical protein TRSC58_03903 [Trypanosoma rangeli SC58]|uniref:Vps41 beta-propeller domain-containing protein n=1 Tax=Trypanosoma rangeli SC58 TaxID=429131 RepID=A0A061J0C1_TRYRA|nr:hypothetical protein TRSC58_03903 [Trypanosoma rangeli SC58]
MVVAAFNRFIVIGTNRGVVALVEMSGVVVRTLNKHVDPISDVSCDTVEEHVGSSDKSGVVTVQNLYDEQCFYRRQFDVSIHSMALHPRYSRNENRPIVVGGGDKVMLITKARILGHRKSTVLQEQCGKVYVVRWCGPDLIAWANDRGVQLYSYTGRAMVRFVARPSDSSRLEVLPLLTCLGSPSHPHLGMGRLGSGAARLRAADGGTVEVGDRIYVADTSSGSHAGNAAKHSDGAVSRMRYRSVWPRPIPCACVHSRAGRVYERARGTYCGTCHVC